MSVLPQYCLSIAGITIEIHTDIPHSIDPQFEPFLTETAAPDYRAIFRRVDQLPVLAGQPIYEDKCNRVYPDGKGGYLRAFFDAPRDYTPYSVAIFDPSECVIDVQYLEKGAHCVSQMHNSFFHLGFETLLLRKGRFCFHAAFVQTHLDGLLFSGPSGIGKSTQADLWVQYRSAEQINGDRPVLAFSENEWHAWGSPYAGSSHCYVNKHCKIHAIIMLRQAKQCKLRRLSESNALRAIWAGMTMYSWDKQMVEDAFDLASALIKTVPVFEFDCTPDADAVDYLERELQIEWNK